MQNPRGVIFDMDGVLVLSAPAHWIAWQETAAAHGLTMTRDQFQGFNGFTNPDIVRVMWGGTVSSQFALAIAEQKEAAFRAAIGRDVPLAPGCRELLSAVKADGFRIAVGTSAPTANVDLVLDGGGIRRHFGAVVHADMVQRGKPAPDIFLRAAELLGLPPRRCVVIEDAPSGIRAARTAGMPAIGVLTNHAAEELLEAGANVVVPALLDVRSEAIAALLH